MKNRDLDDEGYKNLKWSERLQYVKEWACICNSCKEKWYYLDSVEKRIGSTEKGNALMGLGFCLMCNPCGTAVASNATTHMQQQKVKLKSCPKCGSSNVTKKAKYFKKQE